MSQSLPFLNWATLFVTPASPPSSSTVRQALGRCGEDQLPVNLRDWHLTRACATFISYVLCWYYKTLAFTARLLQAHTMTCGHQLMAIPGTCYDMWASAHTCIYVWSQEYRNIHERAKCIILSMEPFTAVFSKLTKWPPLSARPRHLSSGRVRAWYSSVTWAFT